METLLSKIKNWKYIHIVILLLILSFGGVLRLYKLEEFMWWWYSGDHGRDLLVAKHIIEYKEILSSGPICAGSANLLKNSVIYYYLLAVIWFFTRSAKGTLLVFSLSNLATILLTFIIASKLHNKRVGLLAALLMAFSYRAAVFSRSIFQPFLLPFFISLSILTLLYSLKEKSFFFLLLATFLVFLSLAIHYSALLLFPAFALWIFYGLKLVTENTKNKIWYLTLFVVFSLTLGGWLFLSHNSFAKTVEFIRWSTEGSRGFSNFLSNTNHYLAIFGGSLFHFPLLEGHWKFAPGIIFAFGGLIFLLIKNIIQKRNLFLLLFLSSFLGGFLLSGLYSHRQLIFDYQFISLLPIFFILLACLIEELFRKNTILKIAVTILLIIALFRGNERFFKENPLNEFAHAKSTSQNILKDFRNRRNNVLGDSSLSSAEIIDNKYDFGIYVKAPYRDWNWDSPMFWYSLEEEVKKPLIKISDEGNNIQPLNNNPRYLYLICKDYLGSGQETKINCLEEFLSSKNNWMLDDKKPIFSSTDELDSVILRLKRREP